MNRSVSVALAVMSSLIAICLSSCKGGATKEIIPPSTFAPYVSAYTGGIISAESSIRIELTQGLPSVEVNAEAPDNLFDFTPGIRGKAHWINNRTIEFVPDSGQLKQGTLYRASFRLAKVLSVDKSLREFEFTFRVAAGNFVIRTLSTTIRSGSPKLATVDGEIRLSAPADPDKVKKLLNVKIHGHSQEPDVRIEATEDPTRYTFAVVDIQREDKDIEINVTGQGKAIGLDRKTTENIVIPGRFPFKLLYARTVGNERNAIQVAFSEPLDPEFDIRGFIRIDELPNCTFQQEDNKVNIFFEPRSKTDYTLTVYSGIRSETGATLERKTTVSLRIDSYKPQVEIPLKGNILPDARKLLLPFRAVNLSAVDLKIIRIFENNVLSFLQDNSLDGSGELRRVGRIVYKKTLRLDSSPDKDLHAWEDYSVDLADIIQQQPGAIYRVELSFKQAYSLYPCGNVENPDGAGVSSQLTNVLSGELTEADEAVWDQTQTYYYDDNIDWDVYRWEDRENPCTPSYYMTPQCRVAHNLLASNLGVIVKSGADNRMWVTVNNIPDTKPVENADVTVYNFQLQAIGSGKTDKDGFAAIVSQGKAFAVVVRSGQQKTYLKVTDAESNSLSRFDTEGKTLSKGLKGFIYGERGVWRPGDTLHVSFILEDRHGKIPAEHPVSIEIYNPKGQFYSKQLSLAGMNGFYVFHIATHADDPTGVWNAYVKAGGATFHKALRIETVKPNRLKIALNIPNERIDASRGSIPAVVSSSWLTGATAGLLKTTVEMSLSPAGIPFKGYEKYQFNNPAADFHADATKIFEGRLNAEGEAAFNFKAPKAGNAPGMLNANIICRVFEPGGDASIFTQNVPYSPFDSYVGVNLHNEKTKYFETDKDHTIDVVSLSANGQPLNRTLHYKVYKLDWRWWWENQSESYESYVNNTSVKPVLSGNLTATGGKARFNLRINYPDWGRYLVFVQDPQSGHAAGGIAYVDWPDWRGRSSRQDPSGLTMLTFSTDKTSYEVDEEITVIIPAAAGGRALLALENGSEVLRRDWIDVSGNGDTRYRFKATAEMSPNVYLHISLLQPHEQTLNDLPIRMYGVAPILVTNKRSELAPQISMPDVLRPEKTFEVRVKEKNNHPMTYTLAIVDDGLLDLTNFKTPDPRSEFNAREALGVRTWDMYEWVIGAFGGRYTPLFSVGGDETVKPVGQRANRFKPLVRFIGPFALKGGEAVHRIQLPMYVGSVRVMVVAGQNGAYGKAEKTAPVRSPLMTLSTLPRVVSAGEEILLPVNVFAMEKTVGSVSVKVETSGKLQLSDGHVRTLKFSKPGDAVTFFRLRATSSTGAETVKITATDATNKGLTATESISIDVRNPNPVSVLMQDTLLAAGNDVSLHYELGDLSGENALKLEVSRIPSVDITRRLDFLEDYRHYCSEQLTSRAMPLLFVSQFKNVDKEEEETIGKNIREAIQNLYGRQLNNGGFVYWPGQADANEWITSYTGNFLLEAQRRGYEVNPNVLKKWKDYQRKAAQNWMPDVRAKSRYSYRQFDLQQAYRLYTLALAHAPELGVMNRMKEMTDLSLPARWRLAAAYAASGKIKAANEVIWNLQSTVEPYTSNNFTYGSCERDEAMILETMLLIGNMQEAFRQAKIVSRNLAAESHFNTQSTAFALVAMGQLAEKTEKGIVAFEWSLNGQPQRPVKTGNAVHQINLPVNVRNGRIDLRNVGQGDLYVNLVTKTRPTVDRQPAVANNLRLDVAYEDRTGRTVDVRSLKQGTDFVARVRVSNISGTTDYTDLALTHIIPSGWEIFNERLINHAVPTAGTSTENYIYQDIRDDRVLTYFDLERGLSKTFAIRLQAAYAGRFVLPAIQCEAMYDASVQARTVAAEVDVAR